MVKPQPWVSQLVASSPHTPMQPRVAGEGAASQRTPQPWTLPGGSLWSPVLPLSQATLSLFSSPRASPALSRRTTLLSRDHNGGLSRAPAASSRLPTPVLPMDFSGAQALFSLLFFIQVSRLPKWLFFLFPGSSHQHTNMP